MYSSICMVYMPIFIYSSCPALLRVKLEKKKKKKSFVFSETCTFFFPLLFGFVVFLVHPHR